MSQYPSPYAGPPQPQYPGYGYTQPYVDPLGPAKKSGILMFVLGGVCMLCGMCLGAFSAMPLDQMPPESAGQLQQLESQMLAGTGISFMGLMRIMAVLAIVPGVLLIILGFFVRRGGLGAMITSIVIVSLMTLVLVLQVVTAVAQAAGQGSGETAVGVCVLAVPLALSVLLLVWLIQAARAAPQVAAAKAQYQAQYWQYQQQQQAYGQQQPQYPQQMPPPPPPPGEPGRGA